MSNQRMKDIQMTQDMQSTRTTSIRSRISRHLIIVCLLLSSLFMGSVMADNDRTTEDGSSPCDCECGCDNKTIVHDVKCVNKKSPDSLPSLGTPVQLHMVTGRLSFGDRWGQWIGFHSNRSLNYLSKVHLSSDLRFARLYLPEDRACASFERVGTTWQYALVDNEKKLGTSSTIVFVDADSNSIPESATFTEADGSKQIFELETTDSGYNSLPGMAFRVTEHRDRNGFSTTVSYSPDTLTITDASGNAYVCSLYTYGSLKRISSITVNGRSWSYSYGGPFDDYTVTETNNATGVSIAVRTNLATQQLFSVTTTGLDGTQTSEVRTYTDGVISSRTINGVTQTITETIVDGRTTHVYQTGSGNGSKTTKKVYERNGLVEVWEGSVRTKLLTRDARFKKPTEADGNGNTWNRNYDSNGRLLSSTDPDGVVVSYTYDTSGNMLTTTKSGGTWTYAYDSNNLVTQETAPNGRITHFVRYATSKLVKYQIVNTAATSTDTPIWACTYHEYNNNGQLILQSSAYQISDPANPTMPSEYDGTSASIIGKRWQYDSWGNQTHRTDELGNTWTTTYNAFNKPATITDAKNALLKTITYDGLGRKVKVTDSEGSETNWDL